MPSGTPFSASVMYCVDICSMPGTPAVTCASFHSLPGSIMGAACPCSVLTTAGGGVCAELASTGCCGTPVSLVSGCNICCVAAPRPGVEASTGATVCGAASE